MANVYHLIVRFLVRLGAFIIVAGVSTLFLTATFHTDQATAKKDSQIIETAKAAKELAQSKTALKTLVNNYVSIYGNAVGLGLVVLDTSNGAEASYDANTQFVSASIYKLFVAYDVYRQVDDGTVSLNQSITTADPDDAVNTVAGCMNLMITISDDDCGVSLGELDNWAKLDTLLKSEGYTGTLMNNYDSTGALNGNKQTTAADVTLLLDRLYKGTLLKPATTTDFISLLKQQTINDMLPSGLPKGTVIAHKTGDLFGYAHDAGIIYGAKKNVIVVLLTGQWINPEVEADQAFAKLASAVWSYMES